MEEDEHRRVRLVRGEYVQILGTSRPVRNIEVCAIRERVSALSAKWDGPAVRVVAGIKYVVLGIDFFLRL